MVDTITTYESNVMPRDHWERIGPFVRSAISDYEPDTPERARRLLMVLARHVHWCWQGGQYPLERNVLLRREVIAESVEKGMGRFSKRTRGTYRSHLFTLSDALLSAPFRPAAVPTIGAVGAQAPYGRADVQALRSWAAGQSTDYRRVTATLILSLGLGAGLSASEMGGLRCSDVVHDEDGVLLRVGGDRAREVPVLAGWEDPIAQFAKAAFRKDMWVLAPGRKSAYPKNLLNTFITSTNNQPFDVRAARLRATWIVEHLSIGTPVALLSRAAGFESPQALGRYVEFVPDVDPVLARRALHAVARNNGILWARG